MSNYPTEIKVILENHFKEFKIHDLVQSILSQTYDRALAELDQAFQDTKPNAFALMFRGALHWLLKNYSNSQTDLDCALSIIPGNVFALVNRGRVHYKLRNYNKALLDL